MCRLITETLFLMIFLGFLEHTTLKFSAQSKIDNVLVNFLVPAPFKLSIDMLNLENTAPLTEKTLVLIIFS